MFGINMNPYKQIRHDAGMTLSQMSEYLGVNDRTIRRYETGERNPRPPVVKLYELLVKEKAQWNT